MSKISQVARKKRDDKNTLIGVISKALYFAKKAGEGRDKRTSLLSEKLQNIHIL